MLISSVLSSLLSKLVVLLFLDINTFSLSFNLFALPINDQLDIMRLSQPFNTVGVFLLPPLVLKYFIKNKIKFSSSKISFDIFLSSTVLIIVVKPLVAYFAIFNKNINFDFLGELGEKLIATSNFISEKIEIMAKSNSINELWINIFIIAFLPAISEELFFRGTIQQLLQNKFKNYHIPIWITGAIFGIIHFNIYGVIPIIFLGIILGYVYHFSQNIWMPIIVHFINNATLILMLFKFSDEIKTDNIDDISTQAILFSGIMSAALLFFIYSVWDHRNKVT